MKELTTRTHRNLIFDISKRLREDADIDAQQAADDLVDNIENNEWKKWNDTIRNVLSTGASTEKEKALAIIDMVDALRDIDNDNGENETGTVDGQDQVDANGRTKVDLTPSA